MNQRRNFRDLLHYINQLDEWIRTETDVRLLQELKHNISVQEFRQQHELIDIAIQILLAEAAERSGQRLEKQTENLIKLAESSDSSSQRLERHTKDLIRLAEANDISSKRLIRLTWALVGFSIALLFFAAVQTAIMFKEDANTHPQQALSSQGKPTVGNQH